MTNEEFNKYYKSIVSVECPALGTISFNAKGLNHIYFAGNRSERKSEDIEMRKRLVKRAVAVLSKTTIYSGYFCDSRSSKDMHYWEIVAVEDNRRIRIIVRQKGTGGLKHYWSVIPDWKMIRGTIINASGSILKDDVADFLPSA